MSSKSIIDRLIDSADVFGCAQNILRPHIHQPRQLRYGTLLLAGMVDAHRFMRPMDLDYALLTWSFDQMMQVMREGPAKQELGHLLDYEKIGLAAQVRDAVFIEKAVQEAGPDEADHMGAFREGALDDEEARISTARIEA